MGRDRMSGRDEYEGIGLTGFIYIKNNMLKMLVSVLSGTGKR
jgi:hypothetical protein